MDAPDTEELAEIAKRLVVMHVCSKHKTAIASGILGISTRSLQVYLRANGFAPFDRPKSAFLKDVEVMERIIKEARQQYDGANT